MKHFIRYFCFNNIKLLIEFTFTEHIKCLKEFLFASFILDNSINNSMDKGGT